jgi:hypothetical protein
VGVELMVRHHGVRVVLDCSRGRLHEVGVVVGRAHNAHVVGHELGRVGAHSHIRVMTQILGGRLRI